ncbi:hypothetical protein NL676_022575 [Syzygium grande]|nr:hypothetical protein NL676_022575 [Syzygium grande]
MSLLCMTNISIHDRSVWLYSARTKARRMPRKVSEMMMAIMQMQRMVALIPSGRKRESLGGKAKQEDVEGEELMEAAMRQMTMMVGRVPSDMTANKTDPMMPTTS